jgi:hypothetical protein
MRIEYFRLKIIHKNILIFKIAVKSGAGGSCLYSLLLGRQRSGGLWFKASPGK